SGPISFSVAAGTLPDGITLDSTGALTGTPTTPGTFLFTVRATDGTCSVDRDYYLIVNPAGCPAVTLSPTVLPGDTLGNSYNQNLTGNGGSPPYAFQLVSGMLPPGIDLSPDGHLSGVSVLAGSFAFAVAATNANTCTGTQS